ncbi:hypothetical protein OSTOST_02979, partial [Ostertagia ostertagi]
MNRITVVLAIVGAVHTFPGVGPVIPQQLGATAVHTFPGWNPADGVGPVIPQQLGATGKTKCKSRMGGTVPAVVPEGVNNGNPAPRPIGILLPPNRPLFPPMGPPPPPMGPPPPPMGPLPPPTMVVPIGGVCGSAH